MRRGLVLVLGLLAVAMALAAMPTPVQARDLPGALFGVITRPLGAILGAPRYSRRSYRHRRAAARSRAPAAARQAKPAVAAAPAPGAAVVGAAAVTATATGTTTEAEGATEAAPQAERAKPPADEGKPAFPAATPAAATAAPAVNAPTRAAAVGDPKAGGTPEAKSEARPAPQANPEPASVPAAATPIPAPAAVQRSAAAAHPAGSASPRGAGQPPARQQPVASPAARGTLRSGVTGPLTWPTALEDVVGFTLWPGEYSERLRGHGIGDVLNAVMVPESALAARIRPGVNLARADARHNDSAAGGAFRGSLGVCSMEPASDDWLAAQVERAIELNAEQRAALAQVKIAFGEASVRIKATCRNEVSPSSTERLHTMQTMLWAVHDAAMQLRAPVAKFYDTLTAEQRRKFAAPASAQADPRSMTPAAIVKLCGAPQSGDTMLRQAEQWLGLNRAQRASLETFQKKSAEMGQFLMASCLKPVASTPVERIDAAADRLTALIFATSTINLALNDFYNQLDDGQRAKFDSAVR